jgi:hypothetical protein
MKQESSKEVLEKAIKAYAQMGIMPMDSEKTTTVKVDEKPYMLKSSGQFPLRLEVFTQVALQGLTSNPNVSQDPKEVAKAAIQIAMETCRQLEIITNSMTNG